MERRTPTIFWHALIVALALLHLGSASFAMAQDNAPDSDAAQDDGTLDAAQDDGTTDAAADAAANVPFAEGSGESVRVDAPDDAASGKLRTNQRLREIGNQVDALKEDTFATKSRLLLLRESVLRRSIAGSKVVVVHNNDLGSEFELVQVVYALDRDPKWSRGPVSDGSLDKLGETVVIDEKLVPGSHMLSVAMVLKGRPWGIFTYMEGYTFKVQAAYPFSAEEGVGHEIVVNAHEKGGFFHPIEDRPTISFVPSKHTLDNDRPAAAASK